MTKCELADRLACHNPVRHVFDFFVGNINTVMSIDYPTRQVITELPESVIADLFEMAKRRKTGLTPALIDSIVMGKGITDVEYAGGKVLTQGRDHIFKEIALVR